MLALFTLLILAASGRAEELVPLDSEHDFLRLFTERQGSPRLVLFISPT